MSQHRQQPSAAPQVGQWVVMLPGDRGNRAHTQRSHALRLRLTGCSLRSVDLPSSRRVDAIKAVGSLPPVAWLLTWH
jgi:hypothetical protein